MYLPNPRIGRRFIIVIIFGIQKARNNQQNRFGGLCNCVYLAFWLVALGRWGVAHANVDKGIESVDYRSTPLPLFLLSIHDIENMINVDQMVPIKSWNLKFCYCISNYILLNFSCKMRAVFFLRSLLAFYKIVKRPLYLVSISFVSSFMNPILS